MWPIFDLSTLHSPNKCFQSCIVDLFLGVRQCNSAYRLMLIFKYWPPWVLVGDTVLIVSVEFPTLHQKLSCLYMKYTKIPSFTVISSIEISENEVVFWCFLYQIVQQLYTVNCLPVVSLWVSTKTTSQYCIHLSNEFSRKLDGTVTYCNHIWDHVFYSFHVFSDTKCVDHLFQDSLGCPSAPTWVCMRRWNTWENKGYTFTYIYHLITVHLRNWRWTTPMLIW